MLARVREAWRVVQAADSQLVKAVAEAHVTGNTYRDMADFIVAPTGEPAVTNEKRRRLANNLKERLGRAKRATKHCGDLQRGARKPLHDRAQENQDQAMTHDPYLRRRIIEEFGPPPDVPVPPPMDDNDDDDDEPALGRGPQLVGDDDLDGDDEPDDDDGKDE